MELSVVSPGKEASLQLGAKCNHFKLGQVRVL